jgi:diphthine-ammonia ligase
MKVLGLVSGGKDSLFALLQCQRFGHEIVALANLLPAHTQGAHILFTPTLTP